MVIYGAGGHAKVIVSCIHASNQLVTAVFDDDDSKISIPGKTVISKYDPSIFSDEHIVIAIGNNQIRRKISQSISHRFGNVIHPSSLVEKDVQLGLGTVVFHGSIIQCVTKIGNHVIINTGARIDHDCSIGDFVHIAPGAVLCGNVSIGENTLVGAGSIIVPNISIGSNCIIAAGSVITKNIPDGCIVRGNPGKIIKTSH